MEIERKFLINYDEFTKIDFTQYDYKQIEQAYLSVDPVVRIREVKEKEHLKHKITIKGKGMLSREEVEIDINKNDYQTLRKLIKTSTIYKTRYLVPYKNYIIEVDFFTKPKELILIEVEFTSEEDAKAFDSIKPIWFGEEVTFNRKYFNVNMVR